MQTIPNDYKYNQEKFVEKCSKFIDEFYEQFVSLHATYDKESLADFRQCNSWDIDYDFITLGLSENSSAEVYIRWVLMCFGSMQDTYPILLSDN